MAAYAARYARAFADVVESAHLDPDRVNEQLMNFGDALAQSADLRQVLENPTMALEQRVRVIDAIGKKIGFDRPVRNFLAVLVTQERIGSFDEIAAQYRAEMDRRRGIVEAEIATARPLGADERRELEQQVGRVAGSKVRARFRQDSSLIGGVIVRIGSTVYDGSVRGRLDRLKQELVAR